MSYKIKRLNSRANNKGLEFDIDSKWLHDKINDATYCAGCGLRLNKRTKFNREAFGPSIDRIDNNKGYTKDNCQVVCNVFNTAKNEHPIHVLYEWGSKFVENYEKENNIK